MKKLKCHCGKIEAEVNDSIFATVGNKVITRSDILNEIKVILITTGETFTNDRLDFLQASAVKTLIKRNIKEIEISKYPNLQYDKNELRQTLKTLSTSMNIDEDTLENTLVNNELNINTFTNIYKIELLWNKLIFELYFCRNFRSYFSKRILMNSTSNYLDLIVFGCIWQILEEVN